MKRTEAAWAGGALVAAALAAGTWVAAPVAVAEDVGTTATVCQTVSMRLTNWSNTITLPKFDPALGTLQKAIITGTLKVEASGYEIHEGPDTTSSRQGDEHWPVQMIRLVPAENK